MAKGRAETLIYAATGLHSGNQPRLGFSLDNETDDALISPGVRFSVAN
jgi:hypothetical protein